MGCGVGVLSGKASHEDWKRGSRPWAQVRAKERVLYTAKYCSERLKSADMSGSISRDYNTLLSEAVLEYGR